MYVHVLAAIVWFKSFFPPVASMSSSAVGDSRPTLKSRFLAFSRIHAVLDKSAAEVAAKLCEVGKAFLLRKAKSLVQSAEGRAVLYTYGSDATSAKVVVTYTAQLARDKRVQRRGAQGVELLVERAFLKTSTA
eukprot:7103313-Heterocapsa_arctica.AAC.1